MCRRFAYLGRCFGLGIRKYTLVHASYPPAENVGLKRKTSACIGGPTCRRFGLGIKNYKLVHARYLLTEDIVLVRKTSACI